MRQTKVIVTITDTSGRYMGGLHKDQVAMLDNGLPQEALTMEESGFPVSIGLIFNVSGNSYRDSLALTKKTILSFFQVPQKTNQWFIMGFDPNNILTTDWASEPKELISGFDKLASEKPSKNATTYEALDNAIKKLGGAKYSKRALIIISDRDDAGSKSKRDQLLETVRRSNVLVYSVSIETSVLSKPSERPALDRFCSVSGGFARFAKSTAEFLDLLEIISLELKHQYLISFIPKGAEGDWHRLSFEIKPLMLYPLSSKKAEKVPLFARSREGY